MKQMTAQVLLLESDIFSNAHFQISFSVFEVSIDRLKIDQKAQGTLSLENSKHSKNLRGAFPKGIGPCPP